MAKEKFRPAAVEEINNITLYAIRDNYHDRRKTPVGIFADYNRAEEHIKKIIEKHEENKENYDYDIDEIVIDLKVFELIAKLGGGNGWTKQ